MRFHVHLHVDNLETNIAFYSKLFAREPVRVEADYAKWTLEDPRVNFAISIRGNATGVDHLGLQADEPEELALLKSRAHDADMVLVDQGETNCCYARSEKHWITDPQGIAWEHFLTLESIPVFGQSVWRGASGEEICCAAPGSGKTDSASPEVNPTCC